MFSDRSEENEGRGVPDVAAIMHCLRFLAEEAAAMRLTRTLCAIEGALQAAARESDMAGGSYGMHRRHAVH